MMILTQRCLDPDPLQTALIKAGVPCNGLTIRDDDENGEYEIELLWDGEPIDDDESHRQLALAVVNAAPVRPSREEQAQVQRDLEDRKEAARVLLEELADEDPAIEAILELLEPD